MEINYIRTQVEPIAHKYTIRLDRELSEPSDFQEELATIRMATENDIVHIIINSGGGRDDTMKAFLNTMNQSQAHIITEIESDCCSAVTMIFLNGDEFRVSDDAEFMIHTGAYGTRGKENNVRQQVEFFAKSNARLMYKYYKHFLTPEEIAAAIEGKDFWMNSDEIVERLEKRQKLFEEEQTESLQEIADFEDEKLPREKLESLDKETLIRPITGEIDDEEFDELFGDDIPKDVMDDIPDFSPYKRFDNGDNWVVVHADGQVGTETLDYLFDIRNKYDTIKRYLGSAAYAKIVASCLGIDYNKNANLDSMTKLIIERVQEIVRDLNK